MNTLECIKTRHSTRKFKTDQLSRELIDQVLDAGRYAPSGGNTQLTHFMVITNQDVLNELVTLVQEEYGKMPIIENTLPYMVNIIKMSAEGKFVFNYGAPALIVLASQASYANNFADVSCAMQNMMLACNELDLGSCWVNQIRHLQDNERIQAKMRELGLKEGEKVYASLAIGYPDLPNGLNRREIEAKGYSVTYID